MTTIQKALHNLWGKAVSTPNYDKEEWKELNSLITQLEIRLDAANGLLKTIHDITTFKVVS